MANTYSWSCSTVDAYPSHTDENGVTESNVIYNVHWILQGTDGVVSSTVIGTQTISTADLSGFTSYDSLTHDQVVAWVEASMGEEKVAELKASVDALIAEKANPTSVTLNIAGPVIEPTEAPAPPAEPTTAE